jgi:Tol biopolymer transport system component
MIDLVSVTRAGAAANGDSWAPAISPGGRYVAFVSEARNLGAGADTALVVRDRTRRFTRVVDRHPYVLDAGPPVFYFDGRRIGYTRNGNPAKLLLRNLVTGAVTLLSVGTSGQRVPPGEFAAASRTGRYVAFESYYDDPITLDTNAGTDIYVRDRIRRTTTWVSAGMNGTASNGHSFRPSISDDGRHVVFDSLASNLVPGDTNRTVDAFLYDRLDQTIRRINISSHGKQATPAIGSSQGDVISPDGRLVAFTSDAPNLVPDDTNGKFDAFVHNVRNGRTRRVSLAPDAQQSNGDTYAIKFFGSRLLLLNSTATNLTSSSSEINSNHWFVRNLHTGRTVAAAPRAIDGYLGLVSEPSYAAGGRWLTFAAQDLRPVPRDTNGWRDVFVYGPLRHRFALPR